MTYVLNTSAPSVAASAAAGQSSKSTPFPYQAPNKVSTGTIPTYPPAAPSEQASDDAHEAEAVSA